MTAEIISVGTELLLGNIVDTNAAFLAAELAGLGISVYRQTTVGDNAERLKDALAYAFQNADIVITSGGLGPTSDDITKAVAAEFFGYGEMIVHPESWQFIQSRFEGRALPDNVERNALIPKGSLALMNRHGAAPGIVLNGTAEKSADGKAANPALDGKIMILLPGPPHEMAPMFSNEAAVFLREKVREREGHANTLVSRTLKIIGVGESNVETLLQDLIDAQTNPTIAPYAKVGEVHVRLTASADEKSAGMALLKPLADEIYNRLGENIYGEDEDMLEEAVIRKLSEQNKTLAIAESCTGGLAAAGIVGVAGCSSVFLEGVVTYSNQAKIDRLGVSESMLNQYGAVSAETAAAMAEGMAKTSGASVAISITGIAGPEGGTAEKPVGTVFVGLYIEGKATQTTRLHPIGTRNEIRQRAGKMALDFLRRHM